MPGTFVRCLEKTIFSSTEKEADSKSYKQHASGMAARTHMYTHFLQPHRNNEVWVGRPLKSMTSYIYIKLGKQLLQKLSHLFIITGL